MIIANGYKLHVCDKNRSMKDATKAVVRIIHCIKDYKKSLMVVRLICEVLIENSVTRVTVRLTRLAERCQFAPKNHYGFFCFLAYSSFDSYCI